MRRAVIALVLVALPVAARPLPGGKARAPARQAPSAVDAGPRQESPETRLKRARQAFLNNDFRTTITLTSELLYPQAQLRTREEVETAHRLLALSYFLTRADGDAEREFNALLQLQPGFALDPVVDPPAAIEFLDDMKRRERAHLEEIDRRRRAAEEAARLEAERRRAEEEQRRIDEAVEKVKSQMRPAVRRNSPVVACLPFGAGQFQNGQNGKGAAFATTQLALGAGSLALWTLLEVKYDFGHINLKTASPSEVNFFNAAQVTTIVAGGLFWADVVWGVIDALVYFKREVPLVGDPAAPVRASRPRALLLPLSLDGGGAGLAVRGSF